MCPVGYNHQPIYFLVGGTLSIGGEERREEKLGQGGDVSGDWFSLSHFRLGRIEPTEKEKEEAMTTLVVVILLVFLIAGWDEVFPPKKEG